MPAPNVPARCAGFTLLELMVVVAVGGILAAVAIPSMARFVDSQKLRSASFDLVSDLLLARSEAIKRGAVVVLTPTRLASDGWADGWQLNVGSTAGDLITSRTGVTSKLRFRAENSSGTSMSSLSIGSDGRVAALTPVRIVVTYTDPAPASVQQSCVLIDATGRPKSERGAC